MLCVYLIKTLLACQPMYKGSELTCTGLFVVMAAVGQFDAGWVAEAPVTPSDHHHAVVTVVFSTGNIRVMLFHTARVVLSLAAEPGCRATAERRSQIAVLSRRWSCRSDEGHHQQRRKRPPREARHHDDEDVVGVLCRAFTPTCYIRGDSDAILSKIVNAATLEVCLLQQRDVVNLHVCLQNAMHQ